MKILKEGGWKNPWSKEVVCSEKQCVATLQVDEADLKPRDYSNNNDFYVQCPVCGTLTYLPGKDIPLRLQKELNAKRTYPSFGGGWD